VPVFGQYLEKLKMPAVLFFPKMRRRLILHLEYKLETDEAIFFVNICIYSRGHQFSQILKTFEISAKRTREYEHLNFIFAEETKLNLKRITNRTFENKICAE